MDNTEQSDPPDTKLSARDTVILLASVVGILAVMAWSVTYVLPSGKHLSVIEFVLFWFRELLLLGIVVLALAAVAIQKLLRMRKRQPKT